MFFEILFVVLIGLNIMMTVFWFLKPENIEERLIPRDISEHKEDGPSYFEVYSSIRNEPSKWVSTFEKQRVVDNNWLSFIIF